MNCIAKLQTAWADFRFYLHMEVWDDILIAGLLALLLLAFGGTAAYALFYVLLRLSWGSIALLIGCADLCLHWFNPRKALAAVRAIRRGE